MGSEKVEIFTTDDGDLWGVFVRGHVDIRSVSQAIIDEIDPSHGEVSIQWRWMFKNPVEHGDECPWELIPYGHEPRGKAVAVTGFFP
jgi:hypothetical protein